MRGLEVVAGVIAAFFVIGMVLGVLLVVALPAFHRRRGAPSVDADADADGEPRRRPRLPPGFGTGGAVGWEEPPGTHGDGPPPWPGRRG